MITAEADCLRVRVTWCRCALMLVNFTRMYAQNTQLRRRVLNVQKHRVQNRVGAGLL